MSGLTPGKSYGLIKPKEQKKKAAQLNVLQKKNIFDSDSDSESGSKAAPTDYVKASIEAQRVKRQTQIQRQRALAEDATVFQYDEVYDSMKEQKAKEEEAKKSDKKPKYIQNLLKQAELRNREYERRVERKVQKEREAEGDEFKDKEVFVTSAYRKKMEEMQKLEEEEQQRERLEAALDVTKQKDMSGFYRHLYRQTMGEEKDQIEAQNKQQKDKEGPADKSPEEKTAKEKSPEVPKKSKEKAKTGSPAKPKQRIYRQKPVEEENEDADSDFTSDSASEEDEQDEVDQETHAKSREDKEKARRDQMRIDKERRERRKRRIELGEDSSEDEADETKKSKLTAADTSASQDNDRDNATSTNEEILMKRAERQKRKKAIWNKVTIGAVFEAAMERYFKRRAERQGFPWIK